MASIWKRQWKTGSGEFRAGWEVAFADAEGKRQRRQFTSRREADAFRVEIEGQLRAGTFRPDAARVTVKEAAELFLKHCEGRMERRERMTRRNYKVYEGYVRNYICPDPEWHAKKHNTPSHAFRYFEHGIGRNTLAQLTVGTVTKFRDNLRNAGLSVATTRKILAMLQVMLAYAISLDLIAFNAAKDVHVIGRRHEETKEIVPPSKEVLRQLLDLADENFRVKLLFAAATGVRAGELHALRWKHIDFERREVRIETRVDPTSEEDVPKTKAGRRRIPTGESVADELHAWRGRSKYPAKDDLVFPNRRGGYYDHRGMIKGKLDPLFAKLQKHWELAGRNEPLEIFNWHALRHFTISCWIEAGLSPKTVQTFAGHSSLQVTMDRYGHLFRSDDHGRVMDAISKEIFAAPGPARPQAKKRQSKPTRVPA